MKAHPMNTPVVATMNKQERQEKVRHLNRLLEMGLDLDQPIDWIIADRKALGLNSIPNHLKCMYREDWPVAVSYKGHHGTDNYVVADPDSLSRLLLDILAGLLGSGMLLSASPFDLSYCSPTGLVAHAFKHARTEVSSIAFTGLPDDDMAGLQDGPLMTLLADATVSSAMIMFQVANAGDEQWMYALVLATNHLRALKGAEDELRVTIEKFLQEHAGSTPAHQGLKTLAEAMPLSPGDKAAGVLADFRGRNISLRLAARKALDVLEDDEEDAITLTGSRCITISELERNIDTALEAYMNE